MSMIKIEDLTFCYPSSSEYVFDGLNLVLDTEWKLALTGRNGRGKTTLLKLLLGKYEYGGSIKSAVKFDYFPYAVKDASRTVAEIFADVCPEREEWEFVRELSYLSMSADVLYMPFEYLSGGEQTKVLLAALFTNDEHYMLIDEPTNHLDAFTRAQIASYLNKKRSFILVSHDRDFLDGCVDHVLALNRTDAELRSGDFSSWLSDFENRQNAERERNEQLKKDIKRLRRSAAQSAEWSRKCEAEKKGGGDGMVDRGFIGHKAAKLMKRSKAVEDRQKRLIEEKSSLFRNAEIAEKLKLNSLPYRSQRLVTVSNVRIRYDGEHINAPVSFDVERGKRIALNGGNGCGKSSIIKAIMGRDVEYSGLISSASDLRISFVPQDVSALSGNIREMLKTGGVDESLFMSILYKMGVETFILDKDVGELSDGQKKKVLIAKSLCERAHLYIWDEPLNYIDIYSRIQLERLIKDCRPTMIFIEHDSAFRNSVATEIVNM